MHTIDPKRIKIPTKARKDEHLRRMIVVWRHSLLRLAVCRKRVPWTNPKAKIIEAKRRQERWEIEASLLDIEHNIIQILADYTHHPQIWTDFRSTDIEDPLSVKSFSEHAQLKETIRRMSYRAGPNHPRRRQENAKRTERRKAAIADLKKLEWRWLKAYHRAVFPHKKLPPRRPHHPTILRPKRLREAIRKTDRVLEVA